MIIKRLVFKIIDFDLWYEKIIYCNCKLNKANAVGRVVSFLLDFWIRLFFNCDICPSAKIGRHVKIPHAVGIVIGGTAAIGDDTVIMPNVVIGAKYYPPTCEKRHPSIGNHCLIGANSVLLGDITIGDGCIIGAGSVVTKDLSPNTKYIANKSGDSLG